MLTGSWFCQLSPSSDKINDPSGSHWSLSFRRCKIRSSYYYRKGWTCLISKARQQPASQISTSPSWYQLKQKWQLEERTTASSCCPARAQTRCALVEVTLICCMGRRKHLKCKQINNSGEGKAKRWRHFSQRQRARQHWKLVLFTRRTARSLPEASPGLSHKKLIRKAYSK